MVCTRDQVLLGQALFDNSVDIPLVADIGSNHASIQRTKEGYFFRPDGETKIGGVSVQEAQVLHHGDEVELNEVVRFRFQKSHPLSNSVRFNIISRHRTKPWSDGIVLMADTIIVGPSSNAHIVCPNWSQELVFVWRKQDLLCRSNQTFVVDGQPQQGMVPVRLGSRIEGGDFSLSIENIPVAKPN